MTEKNMPAIEAEDVEMGDIDPQSYELAFHVLPTIAEGEVIAVFDAIKTVIKKEGGEIMGEEEPERFELAYEIVKHLEGKNRRFRSAYFGWVRFNALPQVAALINKEIGAHGSILRHLLIKLTRVEEENPFNFHDAIRDQKVGTNYDDAEVVADTEEVPVEIAEDGVEMDEVALDKALEEEKGV